jgi:hypothetical protein
MRRNMRFLLGTSLLTSAAMAFGNAPAAVPAVSTTAAASIIEPAASVESAEPDTPFSAEDGELTPTSVYTEKKPYDRGRELLQKAGDFWQQKQALKASDTALEAYDDLVEVHLSRRQKTARKKLSAERHLAAQIYIESSIAFIKQDAQKMGNTPEAKKEARARLGDLRDVSREYLELQKLLVNGIMELQ